MRKIRNLESGTCRFLTFLEHNYVAVVGLRMSDDNNGHCPGEKGIKEEKCFRVMALFRGRSDDFVALICGRNRKQHVFGEKICCG